VPIFQSIIKKLSGAKGEEQAIAEAQPSEEHEARSLLDKLLTDSRLYTQTKDYKELLDFVVRLRNFAPFNAMLLQVQKPGLMYAASAVDWNERFVRRPKAGARPLLILWPFGPVALVYDSEDTEGKPLPKDVSSFFAQGPIDQNRIGSFCQRMSAKSIDSKMIDAGDGSAGSIRLIHRSADLKVASVYEMHVNRNHVPATQFVTIAHELGHLFLGHLGFDPLLKIPERPPMDLGQRELEAESVAYLVCARNGVSSESEKYLATYVEKHMTIANLDVYRVLLAAGHIEAMLGIGAQTRMDGRRPKRGRVNPHTTSL
jgi:hypothetical protein